MLQRKLTLWTVCLLSLFFFSTSNLRAQTVTIDKVIITADNAYVFGWGDEHGLDDLNGNIHNATAAEIFSTSVPGPETYTNIQLSIPDYLYIAAWSDDKTTQGVLAQFTSNNKTVYTGVGDWKVFSTGIDKDDGANPLTKADITAQIVIANSTNGWKDKASGYLENAYPNDGLGIFPKVGLIDAQATWMWYNPDPVNITNAFTNNAADGQGEYLIFRLPVKDVVGDCCTECCDNFKSKFYDPVHFKVDEKTGQGLFFQSFYANAVGGLKEVSASIVSSSAVSCNGTVSSLGLHFESPTPVTGWTDQLTHPPFSHEITWCRDAKTTPSSFLLQQPLALTIPVSELKCAQTVKFCVKYTLINMRCQACEVIKCYEFSYSELMGGLPRLAQGKRQPTVAPPRPVRSPVITPIKVKTPVRRPMELRPTIRPLTPRPDPRPAPRPPVDVRPVKVHPPVKVKPVDQQPKTDQPVTSKPTDRSKPEDPEKDPRKPVVDQPADGKEAPQKSNREKPATKKPAERKEAQAKQGDDEPANRSVLLKK